MQQEMPDSPEIEPGDSNDAASEAHGICGELGVLDEGALVFESGLARMLGKHVVSVKRAVERGELPPPTRLMGKPVWTVGVIRRHIEERLAAEARCREQMVDGARRFLT